jgi:hypothetical protein
VQSQLHLSFGDAISSFPNGEKVDRNAQHRIRARSATTVQCRLQFPDYKPSELEREDIRGGFALFCKYEPVHICYSSVRSSHLAFLFALRGLLAAHCCYRSSKFKQHFLRYQALTARYEIQSQWEGLIRGS